MTLDPRAFDDLVRSRNSVRAFTSQPVPRELISEILAIASRAPSGTNTQPWQVYVLQGASRDALADKVCAAHDALAADPSLASQFQDSYDYYPTKWFDPYLA
jgi:nitroreductase